MPGWTPGTSPRSRTTGGRLLLERTDLPEQVDAALAAFESAVARDDRFAEAYAGLAEASWARHGHTGDTANVERAVASSERAALVEVRGSGSAVFWSPDGRFVAYFSEGQLRKADVRGGTPATLAEAPGCGQTPLPGTWSPDGVIIVGHGGVLHRASEDGGALQPLTTLDPATGENAHGFPHFLPDGRHFLYTAYSGLTPLAV